MPVNKADMKAFKANMVEVTMGWARDDYRWAHLDAMLAQTNRWGMAKERGEYTDQEAIEAVIEGRNL